MHSKRTISIFLFLILISTLLVVVIARKDLIDDVVIDGGQSVVETPTIDNTSDAPKNPALVSAQELPQIDTNSWEYVLINSENPSEYISKIAEVGSTGHYFYPEAVSALQEMVLACRNAGNKIYINLSYVPYNAQQYYFEHKAEELSPNGEITSSAKTEAAKTVERPGESDHQTGLGVDFTDDFCIPYTNETLNENTLNWLLENCADYGFIQRYPEGKENLTGFSQPYHFRYVGVEAAKYIVKNDLCLEEFLPLYQ